MQKQLNVLISDDSTISRIKIRKSLSTLLNVECTEANDGLDALQKIENQKFDCIILDILMPNMNGIEVLLELKRKNVSVPVVFITADIQQTTIQKCKDLGALAVLGKPFDEQKLHEIIQSLV